MTNISLLFLYFKALLSNEIYGMFHSFCIPTFKNRTSGEILLQVPLENVGSSSNQIKI